MVVAIFLGSRCPCSNFYFQVEHKDRMTASSDAMGPKRNQRNTYNRPSISVAPIISSVSAFVSSSLRCCSSAFILYPLYPCYHTVDPPPLEAWPGKVESANLEGARLALIGCGRLGRDIARCLVLTGACAGSRGRLVLIDHGDALMPSRQRGDWIAGESFSIMDTICFCGGGGG